MILLLSFILLLLIFLLPFIPGIRELILKRDVAPLSVKSDYVKNPHYFAESFKARMQPFMATVGIAAGLNYVKLSKSEAVATLGFETVPDKARFSDVCYADHDLRTGQAVSFAKELYVHGDVVTGSANQLRALACEGHVRLGSDSRIMRWIDATGNIHAEINCDLGISASCGGSLSMESGVIFRRLYAFPVRVGEALAANRLEETIVNDPPELTVCEVAVLNASGGADRNISDVPPHSRIGGSIITETSLNIGQGAVICGHIKTHRGLTLGENVTVAGNIFAEGEVEIGAGSWIQGTVFTQDSVWLGPKVRVGAPGKIKSVIARNAISMDEGATVYGYISTEGEGVVT